MSELFLKIVEFAEALGVIGLRQNYPAGWIHKIDEGWTIAVNPSDQTLNLTPDGSMGCDVPPMHAAIFWYGWLAGIISPAGGVVAAGDKANENTLIEAIDRAIEKTKVSEK